MNKIYKVIWSKVKNCYVVVSELVKTGGHQKTKSVFGRIAKSALAVAILTGLGAGISTPVQAADRDYFLNEGHNNVHLTNGGTNFQAGNNSVMVGNNTVTMSCLQAMKLLYQEAKYADDHKGIGGNEAREKVVEISEMMARARGIDISEELKNYKADMKNTKNLLALYNKIGLYGKIHPLLVDFKYEVDKLPEIGDVTWDAPYVANNTAIGNGAVASGGFMGNGATAVGAESYAMGEQSIAVGNNAHAFSGQATAVGSDSYASGYGSVAIGGDDISGDFNSSHGTVVNVGGYKDMLSVQKILEVYVNPASVVVPSNPDATIAEKRAYYKKMIDGAHLDSNGKLVNGKGQDLEGYLTSNNITYLKNKSFKDFKGSYIWAPGDGKAGADHPARYRRMYSPAFADGTGSIAVGSRSIAAQQGATAVGPLAFALGKESTAMGLRTYVDVAAEGGTAIGINSHVFAENGLAVGNNSESTQKHSAAFGNMAHAAGEGSLALGDSSSANGIVTNKEAFKNAVKEGNIGDDFSFEYKGNGDVYMTVEDEDGRVHDVEATENKGNFATAIGHLVLADADNTVAVGSKTYVGGEDAVGIGSGVVVEADRGIAIGKGAQANLANSTALGVNSKTDYTAADLNKAAYVPIGTFSMESDANVGVISVGSLGNERRIVNVAGGYRDTDAVNVGQLKALENRIDYGVENVDKELRYVSIYATDKVKKVLRKEACYSRLVSLASQKARLDAVKKAGGTVNQTTYDKLAAEVNKEIANVDFSTLSAGAKSAIQSLTGLNQGSFDNSLTNSEAKISEAQEKAMEYLKLDPQKVALLYNNADKKLLLETNLDNKGAKQVAAIAIGHNSESTAVGGVSIGTGAKTNGGGGKNDALGIAIGYGADSYGMNVSVGTLTKADELSAAGVTDMKVSQIALGAGATTGTNTGDGNIAMGAIAQSYGSNSVVLGALAQAGYYYGQGNSENYKAMESVAVGSKAIARGQGNVVLGNKASTGIGSSRYVNSNGAVAIGDDAHSINNGSISIGKGALAGSYNQTEIDFINAKKTKLQAQLKDAETVYSAAETEYNKNMGSADKELVKKVYADMAQASLAKEKLINEINGLDSELQKAQKNGLATDGNKGIKAIAIGEGSQANKNGAIAIGSGAVADRKGIDKAAVYLSSKDIVKATVQGSAGAVSVGNKKETRQIINVAAGSEDTDAVNVAQLKAALEGIETGGTAQVPNTYFHVNNGDPYQKEGDSVTNLGSIDSKSGAQGNSSLTAGINAFAGADKATGNNQYAYGSVDKSFLDRPGFEEEFKDNLYAQLEGSDEYKLYKDLSNADKAKVATIAIKADTVVKKADGSFVHPTGAYAMAIGYDARAVNDQASAIGYEANAIGARSAAFGNQTTAIGVDSIAVGMNSLTMGDYSMAVGRSSIATKSAKNSLVIGNESVVRGEKSLAIGNEAYAGKKAQTYVPVSLGKVTEAEINEMLPNDGFFVKENGKYIPYDKKNKSHENLPKYALINNKDTKGIGAFTLAIGYGAEALTSGSAAIGFETTAIGKESTAIGYGATSTGVQSIALGVDALSGGETSIAIGNMSGTSENATSSVALGNSSLAKGVKSMALGFDSEATGEQATAVGASSEAIGKSAIAFGDTAKAKAEGSVSIGASSNVNGKVPMDNGAFSTAIGARAQSAGASSLAMGVDAHSEGSASVALGQLTEAKGDNTVALGNTAVADGGESVSIGYKANSATGGAVAIGSSANSTFWHSVAIGSNSQATNSGAIAEGQNAKAGGAYSVAIGGGNTADEAAEATQTYGVALGWKAKATGIQATAIANGAQATAGNSLAIGTNANAGGTAKAINTTAIGVGAQATNEDAVAIGAWSVTKDAVTINEATVGSITYGGFAGNSPKSVVSVGTAGKERQLVNVAAGNIAADSTDAINGSQLFATNTVIGNVADSLKTEVLGGNAAYDKDGKFTMTDVGETGQNTIHDAIKFNKDNIKKNADNIQTNTENITKNAGDITDLGSRVTKNEGDIATNTTNISNVKKVADSALQDITSSDKTVLVEKQGTTVDLKVNIDGATLKKDDSTGVISVGKITGDNITNSTITGDKIANNTITGDNIADNSIKEGDIDSTLIQKLSEKTALKKGINTTLTGDGSKDNPYAVNVSDQAIKDAVSTEYLKIDGTNIGGDAGKATFGENVGTGDLKVDGTTSKLVQAKAVKTYVDDTATTINNRIDNQVIKISQNGGTKQEIKLSDGLNFQNGTYTTATADKNGNVSFDIKADKVAEFSKVSRETVTKNDNYITVESDPATVGTDNREFKVGLDITNLKTELDKSYIQKWKVQQNGTEAATIGNDGTLNLVDGDNILITDDGSGENSGKLKISTSMNPEFTTVKTGNATLTTKGLTINEGGKSIAITTDKIDMGGLKIENVQTGTAGTDAVNVKQLKDAIDAINTEIGGVTTNVISNQVVVYTTTEGDVVVPVEVEEDNGSGGTVKVTKYYKKDDIDPVTNKPLTGKTAVPDSSLETRVVNPEFDNTKNEMILGNVGSSIDKHIKAADATATEDNKIIKPGMTPVEEAQAKAKYLVGDNITANSAAEKKVVNVKDLKDVAVAGLDFEGNDANIVHRNIGTKLGVKGEGIDSTASGTFQSAAGNINIVKDDSNLIVKLNKDLQNMDSISHKDGAKITLGGDNITLSDADNEVAIKGVKAGEADTDAVNMKQLKDLTIAYKANGQNRQTVNLTEGLNFVNGDNTTATVDANGKVTIDVSDTAKAKFEEKSREKVVAGTENEAITVDASGKDGDDNRTFTVSLKKDKTVELLGDTFLKVDGSNIGTNQATFGGNVGAEAITDNATDKTKLVQMQAVKNYVGDEITNINNTINGKTFGLKDKDGTVAKKNLDDAIAVLGDDNISVAADSTDNKLEIKLNKNLQNINSISNGADGAKIILGSSDKNVTFNGGQIKGIAAGTDGTDAVNKSQLDAVETKADTKAKLENGTNTTVEGDGSEGNAYKVNVDLSDVAKTVDLDAYAKKDASNIAGTDKTAWENKLGDGTVAAGSNGLVKGKTVFDEVRVTGTKGTDYNVIDKSYTTAKNLEALDEAIKSANSNIDGKTFGLKDKDGTVAKKNLSDAIEVLGDDSISVVADSTANKLNITLNDAITVGKAGVDGKPGVDGTIGVNGADGISSVGINGKDGIFIKGDKGEIGLNGNDGLTIKGEDGVDGSVGIDGKNGISVKGKDGENGVTIKGVDGANGTEGQIGITGADGKDGKQVEAVISVVEGKPGINGTDGITRIKYVDEDGTGHEVATLDDGLKFGANSGTDNPVANKLGSTVTIKGTGAKADENYSSTNVKTIVTQGADGNTEIEVMLDKDLNANSVTVGEKGEQGVEGKPGTPGSITIIGEKGTNGKDGQDGTNGKDGVNAEADIKVVNGKDGVAGVDGKDGITRIEYKDEEGNDHTIATLDDGLKFVGDDGKVIAKKLNETLGIKGGVAADADITDEDAKLANLKAKLTDGNIGVVKGADGLEVKLAKDLKDIENVEVADSIKVGGTDGINISSVTTGAGTPGAKTTREISGLTNTTFDANTTGKDGRENIAATEGQLKDIASTINSNIDGKTFGLKDKDGTVAKKNLSDAIEVLGDDSISVVADSTANKLNITLNDAISVGKDGKDGKPGVDGTIGVNGADGKSSVGINGKDGISIKGDKGEIGLNGNDGLTIKGEDGVDGSVGIDGKDGISVKGKDGKNGVTIKGENGDNGTNGVIGLDGHDGVNGMDGKDAHADIKVANGQNGVDGTDGSNGTDGMTRIVYNDGKVTHEVATMDDGMLFMGNDENDVIRKLNQKLKLMGEGVNKAAAADFASASGNILVARNADKDGLEIKLNKNLQNINSISNGANGANITLNDADKNINVNDGKITGVADGEVKAGSKDAVNGGQLAAVEAKVDGNTSEINNIKGDVNNIKGDINNIKGDVNNIKGDINNIKGDVNNIKGDINNIKGDINNINNKVTEVEAEAKKHNTVSAGTGIEIDETVNANGGTNYEVSLSDDIATKDDGMSFVGDDGKEMNKKLNDTLGIKGGIETVYETDEDGNVKLDEDGNKVVKESVAAQLTDGNIGIVSGKDGLEVKLAKDLTGIENMAVSDSITIGGEEGKTTNITGDGIKTNSVTSDSYKVIARDEDGNVLKDDNGNVVEHTYISNAGINANDHKVTNVKDGEISEDSKDAVNGSQLHATNEAIGAIGNEMTRVKSQVGKAGANAAALAALHPLDFDPDDKLSFAAGFGNYAGQNATAIGAFYRPNESTMLSVGGSMGSGENMVNVGVSFNLDQKNNVSTGRVAMAKEIVDLRNEVNELKAFIVQQHMGQMDPIKTRIFPDIPENHWAYEYVHSLAERGILEGYPDGNFKGDRMMTRYEFATMLYRAMQKGFNVDSKMIKEFEPELGRIRVDLLYGKENDRNKVERVRINNEDEKTRDIYGSKIKQNAETAENA